MSLSYIPQKTCTVCSFQVDKSPKKLMATRGPITIIYKSDNEPLLTVEDKNTDEQFMCKSPANLAATLLAFGAGLLIGAAVVLSGPVGWVAIGISALALTSICAGVYVASQIKHKCTGQLKAGSWVLEHRNVFFDKHAAITKMSMLTCGNGGILTPILSPTLAASAAEAISSNNNKEIYLNAGAAFLAGVGTSFAVGAVATSGTFLAGAKVMGKFIGFSLIGTAGVSAGTYFQRSYIRSRTNDNKFYDNMNVLEGNDLLPTIDDPGDTSNLEDIGDYDKLRAVVKDGGNLKDHLGTKQRLNELSGLSRQQLRRNETARQLLKEIKAGKHPELKNQMNRFNPNRINPTMLGQAKTGNQAAIKATGKQTAVNGFKSASFLAFVFPFISNYFSEEARIQLAQFTMKDMENGISINALEI